jgi:hypothetical protein
MWDVIFLIALALPDRSGLDVRCAGFVGASNQSAPLNLGPIAGTTDQP